MANPAILLRLHNIHRCMHDLPSLQWSNALATDAENWATASAPYLQEGFMDEHAGGFETLSQNGWQWQTETGQDPAGVDLSTGIEEWYNQVEKTDHGKVSEYNRDYANYVNMVWKSTTHVGCGLHMGSFRVNPEKHRYMTFICNYGEGMTMDGAFDTEVRAVNGQKTFDACAAAVDSAITTPSYRPAEVVSVYIGYKPQQGLALAQNSGWCEVDEYRLAFKAPAVPLEPGKLALVAFDSNKESCDPEYTVDDTRWDYSNEGIFIGPNAGRQCLQLGPGAYRGATKLEMNPFGYTDCTNNNVVNTMGWTFNQYHIGTGICMQNVPEAEGADVYVIDHLPGSSSEKWVPGSCSSNWHMEKFGQASLQLTTSGKTCKECLSSTGRFACATDDACVLAPTKKDCTALGGEWCSAPAPSPPSLPACPAKVWNFCNKADLKEGGVACVKSLTEDIQSGRSVQCVPSRSPQHGKSYSCPATLPVQCDPWATQSTSIMV